MLVWMFSSALSMESSRSDSDFEVSASFFSNAVMRASKSISSSDVAVLIATLRERNQKRLQLLKLMFGDKKIDEILTFGFWLYYTGYLQGTFNNLTIHERSLVIHCSDDRLPQWILTGGYKLGKKCHRLASFYIIMPPIRHGKICLGCKRHYTHKHPSKVAFYCSRASELTKSKITSSQQLNRYGGLVVCSLVGSYE